MIWQAAATVALAALAGFLVDSAGFVSAVLGGGIGVVGVWVFALMSKRRVAGSSGVVRVALRAEAAKVIVIVLLLWLAFAAYRDMVVLVFFGAFMVSVLLSGVAFAVSGD
jgi:ATP synthase protein I